MCCLDSVSPNELLTTSPTLCPGQCNMSVDWVGYGYAALVASGGVIGYVKAGKIDGGDKEVEGHSVRGLKPQEVIHSL